MRKVLAPLAVAGALGCGVVWLGTRGSPESHPSAGMTTSVSDRSTAQALEELRGEVAALKGRAHTTAVPAVPASSVASDHPTTADDPADVLKKAAAREGEVRLALEARLTTEGRDAMWSETTETKISAALSSVATRPALLSVRCGTSLCRVVLTHKNAADQRGISTEIAATPPFADGVFYGYDDSEPPKTTLYVFRRGAAPLALR